MAAVQLDGFEIHGFHTFQDLGIGNIVKHAGRRWLGNHEIYAIICNYKHFCVYSSPVNLPKSGAILLFDRKRVRNFRKDGHNWKKKKDGKTVSESHECLKLGFSKFLVGNERRIKVYYVRGQDNPNFARRCFCLRDENLEHIVLVHYRDELQRDSGDKHVYFVGNKDFLESTGLGDNLTVQNLEWRRHEINPMERDELPLTNDSNNSTAPKEDEVSSFDQSSQIEKKRQREDVNAQPGGSGSEDRRRRNCGNTWESSSLQLKFIINKLFLPVFTGNGIKGEVDLVDAHTAQLVTCGPESSGKVEIVVLEGDFDGDESGIWTAEEFKNNIVKEREGKKPLLTGDAFVNLKDGTGVVGEISFTDNSSWTRSRMFSLGVRFVDNIEGIRVREAKTKSFFVLDNCQELFPYDEDEEATLAGGYSHISNGSKFMASDHKIGGFDYSSAADGSIATINSYGVTSGLDEHGLHNIDSMDLRYDQPAPLDFPGQDHLEFGDNLLESSWESDLQCALHNFLLAHAHSTAVAQRRWTKVFSVYKWFSIRKAVIC
ncbi:uncharacterized protein LOC132165277 isoform X1 [Corylus avellana]|uniref:uncharacterized protein LOC132165011 isoform X1 n=1 Tax=Corylus avellana TaxID=13451 RepID=UPI00286C3F33|nr:uncharacterized protein LOC132165011 isoform X1 [Corylus avellana]XP_059431757.1 uncharacterized protein LOC132165277 isoform X1 [Corylus avellana]